METIHPPLPSADVVLEAVAQIKRVAGALGDIAVNCNTYYLASAFGKKVHNYYFAVPPAFHGWDILDIVSPLFKYPAC